MVKKALQSFVVDQRNNTLQDLRGQCDVFGLEDVLMACMTLILLNVTSIQSMSNLLPVKYLGKSVVAAKS